MKVNRKLRAFNQAIRIIAKQEGLSFAAARKRYPRARMHILFDSPKVSVLNSFVKKPNDKWYRVKPGKAADPKNAYGKAVPWKYVQFRMRNQTYWNAVRLYAATFDISVLKARNVFARMKVFAGSTTEALAWFYEDLGVFTEAEGS